MRRAFILTALVFAPAISHAYSISVTPYGNIVRWDHPDLTYYLDPNGAPGAGTAAIPVVKQSFQDWADVPCTKLTFQYLGSTTNKNVLPISGKQNGKNELVWINDSLWDFGGEVLGVTVPLYDYSGTIAESDIAFNGYYYSWNTKGTVGYNTMDVKSVAIHEIGHFFGLQHVLYGYNEYDPPTMAPTVDPGGGTATLNADDKKGVCFLYPASGYFSCSSASDCPMIVDQDNYGNEKYAGQLKCQGGYCSGVSGVSPGSVSFGGTCQKASDCKSPDTCVQLDSGSMVCTHKCDPANDTCPSGYHCAKVVSSGKNYCVVGVKKATEGEPCKYASDCATAFCFLNPDKSAMYCRVPCKKDAPSCEGGKVCWAPALATVGACLDPSLVPVEKKPLDAECTSDAECKYDLCYAEPGGQARCRQPCDPKSPECYSGYWCSPISADKGACLPGEPPPKKKENDVLCSSNDECQSQWCVNLFGTNESFCRTWCNLNDWACPEPDHACVSYGSSEYGVCMPTAGRLGVGLACSSNQDCITGICWSAEDEPALYCTEPCLEGWCPEPLVCGDGGALGPMCRMPPGQEPEVVELPPAPEEEVLEEAESEEEVAEEEEISGETPQGGPAPSTGKKGGGCTAGATQVGLEWWLALVAFAGLVRRRSSGL